MNTLSSIQALGAGLPTPLANKAEPQASTVSIPAAELRELNATTSAGSCGGASETSFSNLLGNLVEGVNAKQAAASQALAGLQSGQNVPLHQTMIAVEEANLSFQLMVEVRNRLLESYQELMRMQV
ncbi:Flagellar hook-basal body complex protein FliE (modular protein) [Verrucomicrobia bacterium]|nr:Flagellar hook-basal body complex protein FliE (modular protein) [Verrucomicrobiota bacterium]